MVEVRTHLIFMEPKVLYIYATSGIPAGRDLRKWLNYWIVVYDFGKNGNLNIICSHQIGLGGTNWQLFGLKKKIDSSLSLHFNSTEMWSKCGTLIQSFVHFTYGTMPKLLILIFSPFCAWDICISQSTKYLGYTFKEIANLEVRSKVFGCVTSTKHWSF